MTLKLESPAFVANGNMPSLYTCDGQDISPPLIWSSVPNGTKSFTLIVDDPDAPDPAAPKMTWVHWVLYNIPTSAVELSEGVKILPAGASEGTTNFNHKGYGGPCPPIGRHRYIFKLYALDTTLSFSQTPGKDELELVMQGHILAQATLIGLYQRGK